MKCLRIVDGIKCDVRDGRGVCRCDCVRDQAELVVKLIDIIEKGPLPSGAAWEGWLAIRRDIRKAMK